ncbi:SAM-dependent methyltransferase [Janthinobacterium agaricidamnosum]|uniref:Cyclopropane-fatty-acyl-phospholipid synthase family protein n=1 Tax=Janthinobacterium agaricidamnosum NBRC 102515 = DSM 9628 TaxID=1349767 RepID=W0VCK8_9BURK|nr:cyclopropane-fatty-acyl-phospholipid synthase family protein [Janthinobacterium agaricidamnosum]CDG85103.1 cyclopropane-fatty-acyl-phospholipid synthase family protein [Janthinobacterium agaricidamnosum NBRC 102515 = DSM 9628]
MNVKSLSSQSTLLPLARSSGGFSYDSARLPAPARLILNMLPGLKHGALRLIMPDGTIMHYGDNSQPIVLDLINWNLCGAVLRSGDIGFAETFITGDWKTDNLPGLIELLIRNRSEIEALIYGSWWGRLVYRLKHLLNRNSRAGSKKNIHAHYDIGNAFYQLWLDPSMTYSSALFSAGGAGQDLEQGQLAKYRRILAQLRIADGARVLEIGCGWGGFAETAARDQGAHVTGLTLSTEQLGYARQRLADAGLADHADLQLCDYRDSAGQYDAIASIEMFEAVGQSYWPSYFACVARNLKPGGRACIQTIVIDDALFDRYSKSTDFIQQYIFPGGMLPSPSAFRRCATEHGLIVADEFCFGLDYAETLRQWRVTFGVQRLALEQQGFDGRFLLTWEFYLAYCEAAFMAGNTDVMQFTLIKS